MNAAQAFLGTWRITEMAVWDRDAFELLGPAFFTFRKDGLGHFRFIVVEGEMDCRFGERDGKPLVEFSWNGSDDGSPVSGRGRAVLEDETLEGRIFLHLGDDSAFSAVRDTDLRSAKRKRGRR